MSNEELVEDLRASYSKLGPIHKVIKTQFGTASGNTRLLAIPEWPVMEKKVDNMYQHLQLEVAANLHDSKPAEWWEEKINRAALELLKMGVKREDVSGRLMLDFPVGERKILRYLHGEFKRPEKVRAGKASAEVRRSVQQDPIPVMRADSEGLRRVGYSPQKASLVGGINVSYPVDAHAYARRTYTPEEERLQAAFSGSGFDLDFQHPVPMDKWKCLKCRSTWIEEPPQKCPKDGVVVSRLNYYVDLVLRYKGLKFGVEPGGKQHDFDSDKKRDDFLRANGIEPYHFDNKLVEHGAWLIVEYFKLLRQLRDPEEHILAIEGHVRHVVHNTTELIGTSTFSTQRPAVVKVIIRA